jgi:TP901 family phage tail tape measure protein
MANTSVNIDVNINTGDAARSLRQLQAQINSFQSALNTNNRLQGDASRYYSQQIKDLANQSGFFTAETVKMRTAASQLDQTLSKGQGTMRQFVSAKFLKDSAQAAQVLSLANSRASALQTQFVATGAAANGFREAVAIRPLQAFNSEATISTQKLAIHRAMLSQSTTSMINFGKNTQWAGRQLMVGFTVPLTIFAATSGKVFREIEKESINFRKVYGDSFTTPEELNANLLAVQGLAKEYTKYGIAVKDTIGLAAQAAAAGSQGTDLIDATTEATRLATLGQMDQNQALETTIALQTAFNLSGKDLSKTINFLNMVENQTVVTLQDLAQAIPRVAPVIKGLGGSVEDMAVMLAAMREGGITAAQGANALKSGLASLINPTDRAVESLDKMGINLNSIINMNRGDLLGTVKSFGEALATLDEFSRQQALEKVFGKFQYARLGALFNNIVKDGSQASRVMDTAKLSAEQLASSAEKELGAIEDSSATKFVAAMEKLKLAIAPIGQMFTELATPVLGFLGSLVEKFNDLPDFAKKFIGFGTVITGIIIPAGTMFLGLLMNLAGTLTKFGLVVGVAFKGFAQGGLKGSVEAVSQALNYMSLAELDAANASTQLGTSTGIVNQALRDQVPAAAGADAAIDSLSRSYAALIVQMAEAATLSKVAFVAPGAAMAGAAATGAEAGRRRGGPRIRRNSGGTIPGSGNTDTVPAMLTPGEFVVNKQATGENLALLYAINKGKEVPGFNKGGQIPGIQYFGTRTSPGGKVKQQPKDQPESNNTSENWDSDRSMFAKLTGSFDTDESKGLENQLQKQAKKKAQQYRVNAYFDNLKIKKKEERVGNSEVLDLLGTSASDIQRKAKKLEVSKEKINGVEQYRWTKDQVIEAVSMRDITLHNAHFGSGMATRKDIESVKKRRPGVQRVRFADEMDLAGLPVATLSDDWATFSRDLNIAANRSKNETMTIDQAISDINEYREFFDSGPAMKISMIKAKVNDKTFIDALIGELGKQPGPSLFTDRILTEARDAAAQGLGMKTITPTVTGLRIPSIQDLKNFVGKEKGIGANQVTIDQIKNRIKTSPEGEPTGFEFLEADTLLKNGTKTRKSGIRNIRTGEFQELNASTSYDNKDITIPNFQQLSNGGITAAANAARGARGRIPANIVEWFSRMTTSINQTNRDDMLQNIPANIRRGFSTARKKIDITRGSVDPIDGGTLKEVSSWSTGQGVGRFMESSRLFETMNNSKFQIAQRSQGMKRDIDWLRSLGPDGPHPLKTWSPFNQENGALGLRLTPEEIQASGGVIWKANKKKLEERIKRDQEFIAGHQKIIDDLQESNIPTIYTTSIKKGEKYFDVSGRIVPRDEQRINNPAASNAILEEKEVALLSARLTGRPKTRIVEREEAQERYDKAKEEIKRIRMAIFSKEMSAEKAKPDLDRLHDETENMAAFVNWGRGREVSYPNVVSRNMGGMIPQMKNIGGQIFDSTKTSRTIVPGVGNKDTVPAMLTPGEFVINKDSTRKNLDLLRSVNNGSVSGYEFGGVVRGYGLGEVVNFGDGEYMVEEKNGTFSDPMSKKEAQRRSKQVLKERAREAVKVSKESKKMMGGRGMGASMGVGALGGAMMMSPMIPGIGQNEGLSSALSSGGMALSLLSILPMMGKFGIALGAVAVPLAAATVAFKLMRENIDKVAQESIIAGQNLGGAAGRMEELSAATGYQFSLSKSQGRMFRFTDQQAQDASQFSDYFEGEKGQGFVKELKDLSSEKRYKKVASIIAQGVADGMDPKTAQAYGNAIAAYTNDAILKARLSTDFKKGKFSSGTQALIDLLKEREDAVAKEATSMGQLKEVNLGGTGQFASDVLNLDGANAQFADLAGTVAKFASIPLVGPWLGLTAGILNFNKEMSKVEKNTKIVATSFGGSLEVLKEVANAETAISEARRNNIITEEQAGEQLSKLREVEESATNRLRASLTELQTGKNVDPNAVQQGLKNALILNSGFDEGQASAVVETMNFDYVAEQLFPTKDVEEIKADPAYSQAVVAVIADTLSGITPENAGSKIADIQSQYGKIAEAIVQAGVDGMSAVEIRGLVTEASSAEIAKNAMEAMSGKNLTETETLSSSILKQEAENRAVKAGAKTSKVQGPGINREYFVDPETGIEFNKVASQKVPGGFDFKATGPIDEAAKSFGKLVAASGLASNEVAELNARFAELSDIDLAINISKSKEEFTRFAGMVKELSKFPGIDIEVMMQTETGEDPKAVAKNIENTIKQIGNIDFKKSFGDNWEEMAAASTALNPQEFINMARKIQNSMGKAFDPKEISDWYKNALTSVDSLRDNFAKSFDKDSGLLKKVTVPIIASVFGENIENQEGIMKAINDALPDGFNPMILPIIAQLMMDPALKELLKNPGNIASVAKYINSGGTVDEGLKIEGSKTGTADRMEDRTISTADALGSVPSLTGSPFAEQTGSDKSGSGSGQKSIIQQLKEEFNNLKKIYNSMGQFINSKKGQFKGIMAGPFGPEFIEYLKSQGEEGLKILNGGINKIKAAYEAFKKIQTQSAINFAQELPANLNRQRKNLAIQTSFESRLENAGFDKEQSQSFIEGIGGPEGIRNYLNAKKKDRGDRSTNEQDLITYINQAIKQGGPAAEQLSANQINKEATTSLEDMNKELANKNKLLQMGYTKEEADQIADLGDISKLSADQIKKLGDSVKKYNLAVLASDPEALAQKKRDNAVEIRDIQRQIEEIEIVKPLEDQVKVQQKIIDGQEKIVRGKQQEVDIIGRNIELKQRELEPLDDQIEKLQELSDKTSEAYDAQIEALDEIYNREENIAKLKQGQLDVAQALSRGDVAAAAQGALGMSQELARQSREEARSALQSQKDLAIKNIQNKIIEIEKQRKKINQDIEDLQMRQRVIQDEIYTIQSTKILPAENKIYDLQIQINNEADRLAGKYNNAAEALENLRDKLKDLQRDQNDLNNIIPGDNTGEEVAAPEASAPAVSAPAASAPAAPRPSAPSAPRPSAPTPPTPPAPAPAAPASGLSPAQKAEAARLQAAVAAAERQRAIDAGAAQDRAKAAANTAAAAAAAAAAAEATRQRIQAAAAAERARDAAAAAAAKAAASRGLSADRAAEAAAAERARVVAAQNAAKARAANRAFGGFISKYAMGGRVGYKGSTERAPGMMYGGSAKKYAYGSTVPGRGMTDKVPALLTPGEFVVRKRVAEQYGPLLELLNGQVFPTMKTNSFNSSSKTEKSGSMYNYNVNVTLNGSDMDANDVANAVMQKIKMTENKGIRSNNIRG